MSDTKIWYQKEVISRTIAAVIWTCLIQIPLILVASVISTVNFSETNTEWKLVNISTTWRYLIVCSLVSVLGLVHKTFYTTYPKIYRTRWNMIQTLFDPTFAILVASFGFISFCSVAVYLKLVDPTAILWSKPCADGNELCLTESSIFVMLFGFILGTVLAYEYYWREGCYLTFPVINLPIQAFVRAQIPSMAKNALKTTFRNYIVYLGIYVLWIGGLLRSKSWFAGSCEDSEVMHTMWEMADVNLALKAILLGTVWVFTSRIFLLYFQLYQSKYVMFPIQTYSGEPVTEPLLNEALSSSNSELLHLWACKDFNILARQSAIRRAELFRVSQPGNHPHSWNAIIETIIPLLEKFLSNFTETSERVPLTGESFAARTPAPAETYPNQPRLRRLATPMDYTTAQANLNEKETAPFSATIVAKIHGIGDQIMKTPIMQYFFGQFADAQLRQVYASCQPIIWLLEGLSHIVAASFTEDSYGVVQKDLPRILPLLIELDSVLDIRSKSSNGYGKSLSFPKDVVLKRCLKWTVKSSLYRIINRFGKHILEVNVSQEHQLILQQYLDYSKS